MTLKHSESLALSISMCVAGGVDEEVGDGELPPVKRLMRGAVGQRMGG